MHAGERYFFFSSALLVALVALPFKAEGCGTCVDTSNVALHVTLLEPVVVANQQMKDYLNRDREQRFGALARNIVKGFAEGSTFRVMRVNNNGVQRRQWMSFAEVAEKTPGVLVDDATLKKARAAILRDAEKTSSVLVDAARAELATQDADPYDCLEGPYDVETSAKRSIGHNSAIYDMLLGAALVPQKLKSIDQWNNAAATSSPCRQTVHIVLIITQAYSCGERTKLGGFNLKENTCASGPPTHEQLSVIAKEEGAKYLMISDSLSNHELWCTHLGDKTRLVIGDWKDFKKQDRLVAQFVRTQAVAACSATADQAQHQQRPEENGAAGPLHHSIRKAFPRRTRFFWHGTPRPSA